MQVLRNGSAPRLSIFGIIPPSVFLSPREPREVAMRFRKTLTFLMMVAALVFAMAAWAQQKPKPFTQERVVSMVRDGFGDESGTKLIEQRGIDFTPTGGTGAV